MKFKGLNFLLNFMIAKAYELKVLAEIAKNKDYPLYWLIKQYNEYKRVKEQIKQL